MLLKQKTFIGTAEYLAMERESEIRNEYVNGQMFAMSGASREHNLISTNIVRVLANYFLDKPCSVFASDMKIGISDVDIYTYPDIAVVCGREEYQDDHQDILLNPIVIIEILSDSTEAYDRGDKFASYQRIISLTQYILVSQYFCGVEIFTRNPDATWMYSIFDRMEDIVPIKSIACEIQASEIYRKVHFSSYRRRPRLVTDNTPVLLANDA